MGLKPYSNKTNVSRVIVRAYMRIWRAKKVFHEGIGTLKTLKLVILEAYTERFA